jgi:2-polyprenyl-6-methoxyphenol hydroxylase-like FAD-dependent oxidoreductase
MNHNQGVVKHVAIVGAGIGGLTLAIALLRKGFQVQVFEHHDQLAEIGAGITLWGNAMNALQSIGAADAVRRCAHRTVSGAIGLHDGRLLVTAQLDAMGQSDTSEQLWALHRAELQQALYARLPPGCVTFGSGFDGYESTSNGVRVHLNHHSPVDTDLLVGADGLHSPVRKQLFGAQAPRYAGYVCYRATSAMPQGWTGTSGEFWGLGDRFGVIEIPGRRLYWFAVVSQPRGSQVPSHYKLYLQERFGHYAFGVPGIINTTPEPDILYHELFDRPPLEKLSDGAVCLLGDAAHPTTPNLGQGAAMAMESAIVLARSLVESGSLTEALARYELTRLPRTAEITRKSRLLGEVAQLNNPILRLLRNWIVRLTPRASRLAQLRPLVEYDASTAPLLGI